MPNSPSLLSYPDVKEKFDDALAAPRGVRLTFRDEVARNRFLFRSFTFRRLDREQNKILYPDPGHTMHGRSVYDVLVVRKKGPNTIELIKITSEAFDTEII